MSWFAVGAGAVAVVGTAVSAATAKKPKTTQELEFPAESRQLIQDVELPLLEGNRREQDALMIPFLQGNAGSPFINEQFGNMPNLVDAAARKGAKSQGINDLGPTMEGVRSLSPELVAALKELAFQRSAQTRTVVPPGYGTFLSPQTNVSQEGGSGQAFQTGFSIAQGLTSIAGAYSRGA